MEEYEEYEEVTTEDFTIGDYIFIGCGVLVVCAVFAFLMKQLRKNVKNVHLKIGNKVEIGLETKEESK